MLTELFKEHTGEHEYGGIVDTIQRWYYGFVSKSSWCATSLSYFMHKLAKIELIGGKSENVKHMMDKCKAYSETHEGVEFFDKEHIPDKLKKDDILFWLWSGEMTVTGNKHVGVCAEDCAGDMVPCIGGNQKDMICTVNYPKDKLYAVYRWNHEKPNYHVGWNHDATGWWFALTEETYLYSKWMIINHHWYYFDKEGYAAKGLRVVDGKRYYFEENGALECALMKTDEDGALTEWWVE